MNLLPNQADVAYYAMYGTGVWYAWFGERFKNHQLRSTEIVKIQEPLT
jgi:hypothetical protein